MSKELISIAQQFEGLPMDSLIGGPLNAAARANGAMAATQTKFMLDTCFSKESSESAYKPIMISMELNRNFTTVSSDGTQQPDLQRKKIKFQVPLLTIIPLNSLGVDEVRVLFDMEVKSSYGEEESATSSTTRAGEISFEASIGYGPFSATIKGSASYSSEENSSKSSHYQKSNNAKYTVDVHAGQLPLPLGVTTIINALASSISPTDISEPTPPSS